MLKACDWTTIPVRRVVVAVCDRIESCIIGARWARTRHREHADRAEAALVRVMATFMVCYVGCVVFECGAAPTSDVPQTLKKSRVQGTYRYWN